MQTPIEDLPSFTSRDAHHAPLLHLILKESEGKPIDTLLTFLHELSCLEEVSSKICAHGLRAGRCYPTQAVRTLCAASQSDRYAIVVKSLLQGETAINGLQYGMTPLMHAAVHGSTQTVATLLTYKATVDLQNRQQETSLLLACKSSHWQVAKLLFDHGASALHADINGQTPLHVAITNHGVEFIEYIASLQPAAFNKLNEISSLPDACQFHNDIFIKMYPCLSSEQTKEVVTLACLLRNADILQHTAQRLENNDLVKHITQAYHADHFDCLDALLKCAEERTGLTCQDISLTESCKHKELINLTKFLVTKVKKNISEDNGEPLKTAAKSGNLSGVEYLIQSCNAKVDAPDIHGATALLFACMESQLEIVDILLKFGADVNLRADETPLTAACKNGQQEIANLLLKDNLNLLDKTNKHGMTPAEVAINSGHATVAANLLKKGATLSFKNTSFHNLCQLGDVKQVSAFLQACTDCQIANEVLLNGVVKTDNCNLLQLLLNSGKVNKTTGVVEKALETACIMGTKATARILIEWDGGYFWNSFKSKRQFHLNQGIKHQHADIVELLLTQGCNLVTDPCLLEDLIKSKDILGLVLEKNIPQYLLNEALLLACSSGHRVPESCVRLLLDASADVKHNDSRTHVTPLLAAITTSSETLVRVLLEHGSDPNVIDDDKNSPLYLACSMGHHSIASQLLYNRSDENEVCKYKRFPADPNLSYLPPEKCPLWISCLRGHLDLVALLTDNKAFLNLQNKEESILEASHKAGQHEVVRLLLEYGADPATLSTVDLKTACHYGYAERAVAISHKATMGELRVCISEACDEGFPEAGMGIIINIPDEDKQKQLFQVLQQQSDPGLPPTPTHDTSDIQTQEENILWKYFYSKKSKEMVELIRNEGYNPNITNTHGTTLFQACLQDKRIHTVRELCSLVDINQRDSVGRNILFYVLKCLRGLPEQAELFHSLVDSGADIKVTDDFGRTLLHEWEPQHSFQTRATTENQQVSKLDISLASFKKDILLDRSDFKKQTPLHAAVIQENLLKARQLLEAGSCPTICDKNKISPFKLATRNPDMYKVFTSVYPNLETIESVVESLHNVPSASFSNKHPASHRIPAVLNKLFHKTNVNSSLYLFRETFETPLLISTDLSFKKEFKSFCEIIPQFMENLSEDIKKEDSLFAFQPILSGSCCEGTKVVAMDEADVLCVFSHPEWKDFDVSSHAENNNNFMKLVSDKFAKDHPQLVTKSCLSVHRVFARFYGLIRKSLAKVLKEYKNLYIREPHSILESTYAISALKMSWSGDVIQWQEFSLDVVPAIPLTKDKIPKELNHFDLLHHIFVVPKWTASLTDEPYCDEAFRLGFSIPEEDLVHAMPDALRQGYKLTKVVMQNCMVIDSRPIGLYISSYNFKCKMFQCFKEMPDFAEKMKTCTKRDLIGDRLQPPKDILAYADQILKELEESIKIHYQESFFLKGSNLLSHPMYREDFRPLLYMRLCRAMLQSPSENIVPWECLAQLVAEQLVKEEHFQRESFVDEISTLKTMGLDANWRSENGACLLYYMIKYGLVSGVDMLVEWGATSDDIDRKGRSAVQVAEYFEQPAIQELLLKKGKYTSRSEEYDDMITPM